MRAICIRQPWADHIRDGRKSIECRSWSTDYRGPLLIVASGQKGGSTALCIVDLVDVCTFTMLHAAGALMPKRRLTGHFAWVFANVRSITPFAVKGKLKIFEVDFTQ